jgi:hypothetical protein
MLQCTRRNNKHVLTGLLVEGSQVIIRKSKTIGFPISYAKKLHVSGGLPIPLLLIEIVSNRRLQKEAVISI